MKPLSWTLPFILLLGCAAMPAQGDAPPAARPVEGTRADAEVAPRLLNLIDRQRVRRSPEEVQRDFQQTALRDVVRFVTPAGYRLRNRYRELGIPVVQALSLSKSPQLHQRLVEVARWVSNPWVRWEGLLGVAAAHNPEDLKFFREALLDPNLGIQFSGVEAFQLWGRPEAVPLLLEAAQRGSSPLLRVYAAQAALRMGDARGRDRLLELLRDSNWVARAMAAQYLGDLGRPEDAELLIGRIGPEQDKRFVLAEVCIAALKLSAKRAPAPPQPPAQSPPATGAPKRREAYELEPLVVTAPRVRMAQPVDVRIDTYLTQLLERLASEPPPDQQTLAPELSELGQVNTPTGFGLRTRYSDLSFLVIEGLAGARDFGLVQRIERIARENQSPSVRAAALVALAYDRNRRDFFVFQEALRDSNITVRFGALEALNELGGPQARTLLADAAQRDASLALRVYAAQALRRAGDPYGRQLLLQFSDDPDWVVRAMAVRYLGELGERDDYSRIAFKLNSESNDFVAAEACLALLKLHG